MFTSPVVKRPEWTRGPWQAGGSLPQSSRDPGSLHPVAPPGQLAPSVQEGRGREAPVQRQNREEQHHFCSHPIGQNSVTWPHLAAGEAGKCSLQCGHPVPGCNSQCCYEKEGVNSCWRTRLLLPQGASVFPHEM